MTFSLFEATLGGVRFSSIAEEVFLVDIVEEAAQMDTKTAALALRDGLIRTMNRRRSLSVRLEYVIRTQDVALRSVLRDKVAAWASRGGILKVNTRQGKRLEVVMDTAPAMSSSMKWTDRLSVTLTAYGVPYWEDAAAKTLAVSTAWSDTEGAYVFSGAIKPNGTVPETPATAILRNMGDDALTSLEIVVNDTHMELNGLNVAAGTGEVVIEYGAGGLLAIRDASTGSSLLEFRTPHSDDDLLAVSGADNAVTIRADQPVEGAIAVRGRWL